MSRKAFITIDGLYEWDPTLFADLSLPTQFNDHHDTITDQLILDTMSLEVLYPDPATFKKALKIFSRSRLQRWQKITDALYHVYDPFINFTRDETRIIIETRDLEGTRTDNLQAQRTDLLQSQRTDNLTSLETRNLAGSVTNTKQVAAWDNSTSNLTDREKDTGSSTDTGTDTITNTGTQTTNNTGTQTLANTGTQKQTDEGTIRTEDSFHSQGDSAMYTPTDVAKKEFELRAMDDAISYIVHDIRDHFCLTVY